MAVMNAPSASASTVAPSLNVTNFNVTTGNGTLTCFGTEPSQEILGQIIYYACFVYDYVIQFVKTIPLEFNLALGLVLGGLALFLILFCCCCCCCCKRCCCPSKKENKKKRKREKKEYEYLDPADAPAIKSKRNPKTKFDMIPLVGTTIEEKVQPSLYSIPVNSMLESGLRGDISGDDPEGKISLGRLQFSMRTEGNINKSPTLIVQVIQAVELNPQEQCKGGTADPYVSVTLTPKNVYYETVVERQNNDPMFQTTFTFQSVSKISSRKLLFQAWHFDRVVVTNPPIGEVTIDLSKYDLEKPVEEWHRFKEVDQEMFRKTSKTMMRFGCLCVSLQYNPVVKKLTMFVLEASDLPADPTKKTKKKKEEEDDGERGRGSAFEKDDGVKIDPMVKASLRLDGRKVKKSKTSAKTNTVNPYFNEMLTFEVSPEHIKRVELSVAVVHSATIGIPVSVGRVVFGPNSSGRARQHWLDMQESPGRPIAQWHVLADPKLKTKH